MVGRMRNLLRRFPTLPTIALTFSDMVPLSHICYNRGAGYPESPALPGTLRVCEKW